MNKTSINCINCNSIIAFAPYSPRISLPIILLFVASFFNDTAEILFYIGLVPGILYIILFNELEQRIPVEPEEPAFNLNKFLDNLKNQNSKK